MDPTSHLDAAVGSRYAVERELGRGGMATVYLAHDRREGTSVALKLLHADVAPLVGAERFAREIRITSALRHPGIVSVLDSGEIGGCPFYTMPYVEGESLARRIARERQLPVAEALRIAGEVADALGAAHARGFVHRDIKPENILLAADGRTMLADFGIARIVDAAAGGEQRITASGVSLGSVLYMSPEQATGGDADLRSDVYALGGVLYEMLAGQPPFTGSSPQAILARHLADPVPSLRTVRPSVGPALERAVMRALAKVPADRYASAAEFAADVARAAAEPADFRAPAGASRRRGWVVGATLTAVGAAVVTAGAWLAARPDPDALDANRVTVYPLIVPGSYAGSRAAGEDVATMIGTALDRAGPLRWVDGWRLLDERTRDDVRALTPDAARALARAERARYFVTGRLLPRGDSVDVVVELNDAASDTVAVVQRAVARGLAADPWRAGLRALNQLLPRLVPGSATDAAAEWEAREPAAVARFLLGEAAFRRVHLVEALDHFREAVAADSSFALAAVRGAQAATWNHRASEAVSLIRLALAHPTSPRHALFARGYAAYLAGRPDSASAEFRRLLDLDPQMATAWMQLGETYTHLLPAAGRPDSLADEAFDRAHALDPSATHLLLHPIERRLRQGHGGEAAPMIRQFLAADPDSTLAVQVRLMAACVRDGPAAVDWRAAVTARPFAVLAAAQSLAVGGAQLPCAAAAYGAIRRHETPAMAAADPVVDDRRWSALVGLQGVLLAQGRDTAAAAMVDSAVARGEGGSPLFLIQAPLSPAFAERAPAAARRYDTQWGPRCAACDAGDRRWQLGVWAAYRGDTATLDVLARDLDATARASGDPADVLLARATAARAVLARGDTAAALAAFAALLAEPVPSGGTLIWTNAAPRGAERLAYAQLLLARRDFRRARDVADVFDAAAPQSYVAYLRPSLVLRAAAADSLGDRARAARYRSRLAALGAPPARAGAPRP